MKEYFKTYNTKRRAYLSQKQREYRADPMRGGRPDGRAGAMGWMVAQIVGVK